ncbi:MAG: penicillin-binding protein 2 [Thermoleophilia bacterium]
MTTMLTPRPTGGGGPTGNPRRPQRPLTPRTAFRIAVLGIIAMGMIGVLVVRLWFLQVIGGQAYAQRANDNILRTIVTEAPRGVITDRTGKVVLAQNSPSQNIVAYPKELVGDRRKLVMGRLADTLGVTRYSLLAKMRRGELNYPYQPVVLARDIPAGVSLPVAERIREFPGVELQDSFVRQYPNGTLAAHLLGYTGPIYERQYKDYIARGYNGNERVGQDGVEAEYEQYLKGVSGQRKVEVDAFGEQVGREFSTRPPVQGKNLRLTIDMPTQRALEADLQARVRLSGTAKGAAGVAIDPNTGEILAIASYPTFDPNAFARGRSRLITSYNRNKQTPLLDRAIAAQFPPGSTFKAITAITAQELGVLSPTQLIDSPSEIKILDTVFPNFQKEFHGLITLPKALEVSSDTYFYQVGYKLYKEREAQQSEWAKKFGIGLPTRIDLPGENAGRVPDPQWKVNHFKDLYPTLAVWLPGDEVNMTVGQGFVETNPLQMAIAYSAIANGGKIVTPVVAQEVTDQSGRVVRKISSARPARDLGIPARILTPVREGLKLAATGSQGTAYGVFAPVMQSGGPQIAGKTGTAESGIKGQPDHAWFVGYAPADNPKIVVAVVVEHGGTGATNAAPAVCHTIAAYGPTRFDPNLCGVPIQKESN